MQVGPKCPSPLAWALLGLLWHAPSKAQVVVVNGLGHFHLWDEAARGSIELMNPTDDSVTVLLHRDSLWGPQHPIRVASEVRMTPRSRTSVAYEWLELDSASQGTRLYVATVPNVLESGPGRMAFQITTRYAVDLYRGQISDHLELEWTPKGVSVCNTGHDFWAGAVYPLSDRTRGSLRVASGVLRPGDCRIWNLPHGSDGVWLERVDGHVVASRQP